MSDNKLTISDKLIDLIKETHVSFILIFLSVIFIIFSLKYNDDFIYYGFITVVYGILSYWLHMFATAFYRVEKDDSQNQKNIWKITMIERVIQIVLLLFYIGTLILIS